MKTERFELRMPQALKKKYAAHAKDRGMALGAWVLNSCAEQYHRDEKQTARSPERAE